MRGQYPALERAFQRRLGLSAVDSHRRVVPTIVVYRRHLRLTEAVPVPELREGETVTRNWGIFTTAFVFSFTGTLAAIVSAWLYVLVYRADLVAALMWRVGLHGQ